MADNKIYILDREKNLLEFKAGEIIFRKGEPATYLFIVQSGEVEIRINDGHSVVVQAGNMFGEMALISHEPRSATAVAKTNVKLIPVDERRFNFMVAETPNFALTVLRVIADRLRKENESEVATVGSQTS